MFRFSVVTISYNQKDFLRQCVDSVLNQNYQNMEFIVVDPGSTDGSREILDSYGELVKKIYKKDKGPAEGLCNGFAEVTGDILCFLNSDDYLEPGCLNSVAEYFESHPEKDLVVGGGFIDRYGNRDYVHPEALSYKSLLYRSNKIFQQGTFFRKSLFDKASGFNPTNSSCWDYELFLSFMEAGADCGVLQRPLASFRIHGDSITGSGRLNSVYEFEMNRIYEQYSGNKWSYGAKFISLTKRFVNKINRFFCFSKDRK